MTEQPRSFEKDVSKLLEFVKDHPPILKGFFGHVICEATTGKLTTTQQDLNPNKGEPRSVKRKYCTLSFGCRRGT